MKHGPLPMSKASQSNAFQTMSYLFWRITVVCSRLYLYTRIEIQYTKRIRWYGTRYGVQETDGIATHTAW